MTSAPPVRQVGTPCPTWTPHRRQETATVGASRWIWLEMDEVTVSFSQSFAWSSSTTTTSTEATTCSAVGKPLSVADSTAVHPVVRLTRDVDVRVGNRHLGVKALTLTLRRPDAAWVGSADPVSASC